MMVLIKTQVYLSLQKRGYQAKVFWVLDKPAEGRKTLKKMEANAVAFEL